MKGFVLMTAMPPTIGHDALVEFAGGLGLDSITVIVMTQPGEPYPYERYNHFKEKFPPKHGFAHYHFHETIEQNPESPGFRQMWANLMTQRFGFEKGDFMITSEPYGAWMAEWLEGTWIPFDIDRGITYSKASDVRMDYVTRWNWISPEFRQKHLTRRITTFGAESVGKTTLSRSLPSILGNPEWAQVLPEWARPYLEAVGPELSTEKMQNIFRGQSALQLMKFDKPFIIQDTDLFSTLGYWRMYEPDTMPSDLIDDAILYQSDLYVLCPSDIPFVPNELRYGGDKRESNDQYWIDLLEEFNLNYIILDRKRVGIDVRDAVADILPTLTYDRNGY